MRKEKIILFIIILLVILVVGIIGLILILNQQEEDSLLATDEVIINNEIDNKLKEVTNRNNFYIVQNCIEKFYTNYSEIFDDPLEGYKIKPAEGTVDVEKIKSKRVEKVYKMLDDEYLQYSGITVENLTAKLSEFEDTSIIIKDMYYIDKNETISSYFVYGTKYNSSNSEAKDFSIMVKLDSKNRTFKILLDDYVENYYKDLEPGKYVEIDDEEIKSDTYNVFSYEHIADEEYINDLFEHYKNTLKLSKEESYNLLNKDYKESYFENINDYLIYINSNYSRIVSAKLEEYDKEDNNTYREYLFKDNNGNYYIFKETAPFKYTVILDNYTMPTSHFTEEYNNSSETEKVVLNIKRFFTAIDDKNYGYSYSVLSSAFKNNKYPTKNDFVNFAKQNFFEENEIEYISYEKENGIYIYKIKLTDATGNSSEEKTFNILLRLNSGTDFEMSFGE